MLRLRRRRTESMFGATLPVELVPETTPDDAFEELAFDWIVTYYPEGAFVTHAGRAWSIHGGRYKRPDIVTLIAGTGVVVVVADAKRHKKLEKRSVDKVLQYRRLTNAERALVFVPQECIVGPKVIAYAKTNKVEVIPL